MNILQVNTTDIRGGAARIALSLHEGYRLEGLNSRLAVAIQEGEVPGVYSVPISQHTNRWVREWKRISGVFNARSQKILSNLSWYTALLGEPNRLMAIMRGYEYFHYPGTQTLFSNPDFQPDVVQLHNLHGDYFDLRILPSLTAKIPTVWTLHDLWSSTGHCAYSLGCERWRSGCGKCPDLSIYPSLHRDGTAFNWERKQHLYQQSSFYVTTPSHWLLDQMKASILWTGVMSHKVIPNGVDLSVFNPGTKLAARKALNLPFDAKILLVVGNRQAGNVFKDFDTIESAARQISRRMPQSQILFVCLGGEGPELRDRNLRAKYIPATYDANIVARYYQSADLYLHASKADTFPTTVLESLACSLPVIATAVGGIPEQLVDGFNGYLVKIGDHDVMAEKAVQLLEDEDKHRRMANQAAEDARRRFDRRRMVNDYISFLTQIRSEITK